MVIVRLIFSVSYLTPTVGLLLFMMELSYAVRRPTRQTCLENAATEQVAVAATCVAYSRISDWCFDCVMI
jgi:hypothetical protein